MFGVTLLQLVIRHPIVAFILASPVVVFLAYQKWHGQQLQRKADLERRNIKL
jgi:hypothetical protein